MASSDEEGEIIPDCVTNYHFVNNKEEPISFSVLPLQWSEDEVPDDLSTQIVLRGIADSGLQQIYKKVIAWKLELSYMLPEIYVLSKDKIWIKLQRPRKCFEVTIKTILITVHFLHFVKKNPEASKDDLWNRLLKAFSSYEIQPSENDLLDNMPLIKKAAMRDKDIAKSEYLSTFLLEIPGKCEAFHEEKPTTKRSKFIVDMDDDDDDDDGGGGGDDDDECDDAEDALFGYVCALCDNGGKLLCCEGRCLRSFHPTMDAGTESFCESLGYTDAQVEAIQTFLCQNCQYQQHQCFACGMLGSSNKSSGAEVLPCVSATCGHFYHPKCVAELLHPWDETQAQDLLKEIVAGESFTCPAHKCSFCKQGEDKKVYDLQFAVCRRCPKAYHRKCLPRKIAFDGNSDKNLQQRAWDDLLPNRVLIYCMDHKIIPELGTPERDHILFADVDGKKKQHISGLQSSQEMVVVGKRSKAFGNLPERTAPKKQKQVDRMFGATKCGDSTFGKGGVIKYLKDNNTSVSEKIYKSSTVDKIKSSLRNDRSNSLLSMKPYLLYSKHQNMPSVKTDNRFASKTVMMKASRTRPLVDDEMESRILMLMKSSTSAFNMEEFAKQQKGLSTHSYSPKVVVDKTITKGKVEGSVKAVRAALKKLEEGCNIEDAKAVCEPEVLNQIIRWKRNLAVYLAPFLHGMRYTSFGRHFTKLDKLKEIVDRLQWYVHDDDMIVDFCCGSNDFSCLMKEKLDKMGRRCSFKNYDLITPKNDFNFEKRDWMSICLGELPAGSRLIMGLNPPFGVQASLANKFINKALKFKPKLLVLIVPKETKRLDKRKPPYDMIWEDAQMLYGKSFYLPGSVDVHDQQLEQWNLDPPPLYLWSRSDWTAKHKEIAQQHGHLSREQEVTHAEGNNVERVISNYLMEENHDCYGDFSNIMKGYGDISSILDDVPEESDDSQTKGTRSIFPHKPENSLSTCNGDFKVFDDNDPRNRLSTENLNAMPYEGKHEIGQNESTQIGTFDIEETLQEMDMELSSPVNNPISWTATQSFLAGNPFGDLDRASEMNARVQPSHFGHHLVFGTENGTFSTTLPNATGNWYMQSSERAFSNGTYIWPPGTSYYPNNRPLDAKGQAP